MMPLDWFWEIAPVVLFMIVLLVAIWSDRMMQEQKRWNNGKCENCQEFWMLFSMNEKGRGYRCECGRAIWLTKAGNVFED